MTRSNPQTSNYAAMMSYTCRFWTRNTQLTIEFRRQVGALYLIILLIIYTQLRMYPVDVGRKDGATSLAP